jgi:hypothetical protein
MLLEARSIHIQVLARKQKWLGCDVEANHCVVVLCGLPPWNSVEGSHCSIAFMYVKSGDNAWRGIAGLEMRCLASLLAQMQCSDVRRASLLSRCRMH